MSLKKNKEVKEIYEEGNMVKRCVLCSDLKGNNSWSRGIIHGQADVVSILVGARSKTNVVLLEEALMYKYPGF